MIYVVIAAAAAYVAYRHFVTKTPLFPKYGI